MKHLNYSHMEGNTDEPVVEYVQVAPDLRKQLLSCPVHAFYRCVCAVFKRGAPTGGD